MNQLGVRDVKRRDVLTGKKGVDATLEHAAGEVAHNGLGLEVKVAEHFIGPPAANQADDIGVNLCKKESHRVPSTEGLGRDVNGEEAKRGAQGRGRHT